MNKVKYNIYPTLLDSFYWAKRLGKWQELIDKINRVSTFQPTEAIQKGQCFEQTVNELLNKQIGTKPKEVNGKLIYRNTLFDFDCALVDKVVKKLSANIGMQQYIQGEINTPLGLVKCYGFVDYVYPDMYVDLKTTANYKKGKYVINTQHKCYPLIGGKKSLTYLVTDFNQLYNETYTFTPELKEKFIFELTEFIEWLNIHRGEITDSKIFNF